MKNNYRVVGDEIFVYFVGSLWVTHMIVREKDEKKRVLLLRDDDLVDLHLLGFDGGLVRPTDDDVIAAHEIIVET